MVLLTAKFDVEPKDVQVYKELERCAITKHGITVNLVEYELKRKQGVWLHKQAVSNFKCGAIYLYRVATSDAHTSIEARIDKQIEDNKVWADTHGCAVSSASVITCRHCGSKINTAAYKNCVYNTHDGWHCPVCTNSLESMTFNEVMRRRKHKLDKMLAQYKELPSTDYYYLAVCFYLT